MRQDKNQKETEKSVNEHWFDRLTKRVSSGFGRRDAMKAITAFFAGLTVTADARPAAAAPRLKFSPGAASRTNSLMNRAKVGADWKRLLADKSAKGYSKQGAPRSYYVAEGARVRAQMVEQSWTRRLGTYTERASQIHVETTDAAGNVVDFVFDRVEDVDGYTRYAREVVGGKPRALRVAPVSARELKAECKALCTRTGAGADITIPCSQVATLLSVIDCASLAKLGKCVIEGKFGEPAICKMLRGACNAAVCLVNPSGTCLPSTYGPRLSAGKPLPGEIEGCCPGLLGWQVCYGDDSRFAGCCPAGTTCDLRSSGAACELVSL